MIHLLLFILIIMDVYFIVHSNNNFYFGCNNFNIVFNEFNECIEHLRSINKFTLIGYNITPFFDKYNYTHPSFININNIFKHPNYPYDSYTLSYLSGKYLNNNKSNDGVLCLKLYDFFVKYNFKHINDVNDNISFKSFDKNIILNFLHIADENIDCIYYLCNIINEYDVYIVCNSNFLNTTIVYNNYNIHICDKSYFKEQLFLQNIYFIELLYNSHIVKQNIIYKEIYETHSKSNTIFNDLKEFINNDISAQLYIISCLYNDNFKVCKKHIFNIFKNLNYAMQLAQSKCIYDINNKELINYISNLNNMYVFEDFNKILLSKLFKIKNFFDIELNKNEIIIKNTLKPYDNYDLIHTIKIIINHKNSFNILKNDYNISIYNSKKYPELILLNTSFDITNKLSKICKNLIINKYNGNVISYPLNNFTNKPLNSVKYYLELKDSYIINLYYYKRTWNISINKNPDGIKIINKLFWNYFNTKYNIDDLNFDFTYVFEFNSKFKPLTIKYDEDDIILLCVRNKITYEEYDIFSSDFDCFKKPQIIKDIKNSVIEKGFLIIDKNFDKFKIVKQSFRNLKFDNDKRNINVKLLEIILENKEYIFIKTFPNYKNILFELKNKYIFFKNNIELLFNNIYYDVTMNDSQKISKFNEYDTKKYFFALYHNNNKFYKNMRLHDLYNDIFNIKKIKTNIKYNLKKKWMKIQFMNASKIIKYDTFNLNDIRYVAGFDISFHKNDNCYGCSYLTIYDIIDKNIVYETFNIFKTDIIYVSGFLGFRETPEYIKLLSKLKNDKPEFYPHILMVDGCGILHKRNFGSASQLGIAVDIPSIGITKSLLQIDGLKETNVKQNFNNKCFNTGDFIDLIGNSGKHFGVALKSSNIIKPIYVSIGHKISIETAIKITLDCCIYKIPEPIRNSDTKSRFEMLKL